MMRKLAVVVLAVWTLVACSGSGDDATPSTSESIATTLVTTEPTVPAPPATEPVDTVLPDTVAPTTDAALDITVGDWTSIAGRDDCMCSDGSGFELWERPADPPR